MKLDGIELRRISMPLVDRFRTTFGWEHARDILLVRAIGIGACSIINIDTSASSRYWECDLITEPSELAEGNPPAPRGAGLGVTVDFNRLEDVTTAVKWIPAR